MVFHARSSSYVWNRQGLRWVAATRETALLPARNIPRCCFFRVGFGGAKWERESFSPLKKVPDSFKRVVRVKYRSSKNKAHSNFSFLFFRWHLQLNQKQNGGVSFALPSLPCQQQKSSDPQKKRRLLELDGLFPFIWFIFPPIPKKPFTLFL